MAGKSFHPGDRVIFTSIRRGSQPDARAKDIRPEPHGEGYLYAVQKFWVVTDQQDQTIVVRTRTGKVRRVNADDPQLNAASWWQRLIYRNRFPIVPPPEPGDRE